MIFFFWGYRYLELMQEGEIWAQQKSLALLCWNIMRYRLVSVRAFGTAGGLEVCRILSILSHRLFDEMYNGIAAFLDKTRCFSTNLFSCHSTGKIFLIQSIGRSHVTQ